MRMEHTAFNVADPVAVAEWYCTHCGFRVVHHVPQPAQTHFLADYGSGVMEIYCNPPDQVPDYKNQNPLIFHIALMSEDPAADAERLCKAGAAVVDDLQFEDGTRLIMMRDPWGLALQLCRRARPLVKGAI